MVVAKDRIEEYRDIAEQSALVWKEHGALDDWQSIGDDVDADTPCHASFQ